MRKFVTSFIAINRTDGKMKKFLSEWYLLATSFEEAEKIARERFPYLTIEGEFVCEIDEHSGFIEVSFSLN